MHAHRIGHPNTTDIKRCSEGCPSDDHFWQQYQEYGRFSIFGVLHRFPDLQLIYAEAQIGWIPTCSHERTTFG